MIRWLLDTDHVTLLGQGHQQLQQRIATTAPDEVAVSPMTIEEVYRGRLAYLARSLPPAQRVQGYANLVLSIRFFEPFPIVPYALTSEDKFQRLRGLRIRIGTMDLRIAATALAHNLIVLTRNRRDFGQVPNLTIEDWTV